MFQKNNNVSLAIFAVLFITAAVSGISTMIEVIKHGSAGVYMSKMHICALIADFMIWCSLGFDLQYLEVTGKLTGKENEDENRSVQQEPSKSLLHKVLWRIYEFAMYIVVVIMHVGIAMPWMKFNSSMHIGVLYTVAAFFIMILAPFLLGAILGHISAKIVIRRSGAIPQQ